MENFKILLIDPQCIRNDFLKKTQSKFLNWSVDENAAMHADCEVLLHWRGN